MIADSASAACRGAAPPTKFKRARTWGFRCTRHALLVLRLRNHGHGPHTPKAVWGFNGTERPGAVYLAAVLAGHTQKGLPAFGIYGKDVQDAERHRHPRRRARKAPRFAQCGLAVALMRGKSYLSIGGISMGIAGSVVDRRTSGKTGSACATSTSTWRRSTAASTQGIYDQDEYEKRLAWVRENLARKARTTTPRNRQRSARATDAKWWD